MDGREGNWRSLNPDTAMRGVRNDMSRNELIEVAYNARCGAARRIALVRLNDPAMIAAFAQEDPDPMVRRGLVRRLEDTPVLEHITEEDEDASVREAAEHVLMQLKIVHSTKQRDNNTQWRNG